MHAGLEICEIRIGDDAAAWRSAGFLVDDSGICRIGSVAVRLVGADGDRRILGWTLDGPTEPESSGSVDLDGLATELGAPKGDAVVTSHPNRARLIDHVVVMSPDDARTVAAFAALGIDARRVRETDSYGAPMRQTFFRAGEVIIELVGPETPSGDGPAAFFGLAITVEDLDALPDLLGDHLGSIKEAVQDGRKIATLRHKQLGLSVPVAFMSDVSTT